MKHLCMIVPLNNDTLLSPERREILNSLGHDSDWMAMWVLHQWPLMGNPHSSEVYERLHDDLARILSCYGLDDEGQARQMDAILDENLDKLAAGAEEIYVKLAPYVGQIPNQRVAGVQTDPFGKRDMVLTFQMEAA